MDIFKRTLKKREQDAMTDVNQHKKSTTESGPSNADFFYGTPKQLKEKAKKK